VPVIATRRSLLHASAIVVAPATYNTINKWANGTSDACALGILAESPGLGSPTRLGRAPSASIPSRGTSRWIRPSAGTRSRAPIEEGYCPRLSELD
jgi:Flavoprotein